MNYLNSIFNGIIFSSRTMQLRKQIFQFCSKHKQVDHIRQCCYSNQHDQRSTIYALSTASGMSAIAVVRISGPRASNVFYRMGKHKKLPFARKATLFKLRDPETAELLDNALVLWFPSPNSYTGEDMCELHIHGGTSVIKSILTALHKLPRFRLAEPGEFTKRAFLAGKLDLTEVEGLSNLLHAETEAQQRQALRQIDGALYKLYSDWSGRLKKCLARLEAYIDFSEDQHLEDEVLNIVQKDLEELEREMKSHLSDHRKGQKLKNGVMTVLIGKPNVGKSSLLNYLCQKDIAIVSAIAGTTRDLIESSLNLSGYLVNICDTAGIRQTSDFIEEEGVRRAKHRSSMADFLIFIVEANNLVDISHNHSSNTSDLVELILRRELGDNTFNDLKQNPNFVNLENVLILINKSDLVSSEKLKELEKLESIHPLVCVVSCLHEHGMENFISKFSDRVKTMCCGHLGEEPAISQERHRLLVQKSLEEIQSCRSAMGGDMAIAAYYLHDSMAALGRITGRVGTEDLLDVIFKEFCIGK